MFKLKSLSLLTLLISANSFATYYAQIDLGKKYYEIFGEKDDTASKKVWAAYGNVTEDDNIGRSLSDVDVYLPSGGDLVFSSDSTITGFTLSTNGNYEFDAASYDSLMLGEEKIIVIPITVTDETENTTNGNLTITITGINDDPVVIASLVSMNENSTISGQISASDIDLPLGYALTFSTTSSEGGLILNTDGSYLFDSSSYNYMNAGETKFITIPIIATDDIGSTGTANLRIRISGL